MRLLNKFTEAVSLRKMFIHQYGDRACDLVTALESLGPSPHPDDVDSTFASYKGLGSHNRVNRKFTCYDCGGEFDEVVELGEESDYGSDTACLCAGCLIKALQLLEGD